MLGGKNHGGFTMVEVMVFLAVSGVLFLIAVLAINGKQAQADFAVGVNSFNARLQSVINDVSTGFFPEDTSYVCKYSGGPTNPGTTLTISEGSGTGQGTHPDCIFLGKLVHFDKTDHTKFYIISIVSDKNDNNDQPITTYKGSNLVPIDPNYNSAYPNFNEVNKLTNGLEVKKVVSSAGAAKIPAAFGVFSNLSQNAIGYNALNSVLLSINGSVFGDDIDTTESNIAVGVNAGNYQPQPGQPSPTMAVCLQHGVGGKEAAIIIGSHSRQLYTEVHIDDYAAAVAAATGGSCDS